MRKSTRWVASLALAAAIPASAVAGPFDFLRGKSQAPVAGNQAVAEQVADALRAAQLQGRDVEIEFQNGTVVLTGTIADPSQKAKATQAASHVAGVRNVDNRMQVAGSPVQTAAASGAFRGTVVPASNEVPANEFDAPRTLPAPPVPRTPVPRTAPNSQFSDPGEPLAMPTGPSNQEVAQRIAEALKQQQLQGYDIEIRYENGIATLGGAVTSRQQWEIASQATRTVPGVRRVMNKMRIEAPRPVAEPQSQQMAAPQQRAMPPQMAAAPQQRAMPQMSASRMTAPQQGAPIQPVNYRQEPPMFEPAPAEAPVDPAAPVGPPPGWVPPNVPPAPYPYAHPGAGMPHQAYSMPNVPQYAWPSYAAYPNSAQISYPQMYSASAWPYIGPFYPYPQVPLGWREAQLEWDDGYWHLNFKPRTSQWFWFANPHNWD